MTHAIDFLEMRQVIDCETLTTNCKTAEPMGPQLTSDACRKCHNCENE